MYDLGIRNYRFSISWTRIMPYNLNYINEEGIEFYHNLLDELYDYNITPYVTLYNWDLPNYLSPGWIYSNITDFFLEYSKIIFREYHYKVKFWITINEPLTTALQGYGSGIFAPGLENLQYLAGHYQLLAHGKVAKYYKENYNGKIGITLNSNWYEPKDTDPKSIENACKETIKNLGWFADPLFFGKYPDEIAQLTPAFTQDEQNMLKNSSDFLGLNHYTSYYVDYEGHITVDPTWTVAQSNWLYNAPFGMSKILHFIKVRYGNIPVYITECGFSMRRDNLIDIDRISYLSGYLKEAERCEKEGLNVKAFFMWSFLDNFEWASGYNETFGIVYVDRETFERKPKLSAYLIGLN
jgi:beta-glucosidase